MFDTRGLATDGPNLAVPRLDCDGVEGTRRWTIKNLARRGVESAFVTRTLEALVIARIVNGTTQVRALLTVSVIGAVRSADQDRGVFLSGIVEIQATVWRECFGAGNLCGRKGFEISGVDGRFGSEATCAEEERCRCQTEKVAKLTTCDLSFFVTFVRKFGLIRSRRRAHVVLVVQDATDRFI
jgi:hypothetical protein